MMIDRPIQKHDASKLKLRMRISNFALLFVLLFVLLPLTGCTTLLNPIHGTPVSRLPEELLGEPRANYVNVPVVMLSIPPGQEYRLDEGDILGVYIEGVLPFNSPTAPPTPPPVHFPDGESSLPPSTGFPIPVQPGGFLDLPLLKPLKVKGMTLAQARDLILESYIEAEVLRTREAVPVLSIIKERTYGVIVTREDAGGATAGRALQLPAYQNDVLRALTLTGGLPGFKEKNEVTIFKTSRIPYDRRAELMTQISNGDLSCLCGNEWTAPSGFAYDSMGPGFEEGAIEAPWVIRIPLRVPPGQVPRINAADIELQEGDIVYVESRETEFFYTGGMLSGGQIPLPRDYDLRVLGALALAGKGVASSNSGGGGMMMGLGGPSPTQMFVIRELPCGRTFNISVDLQQALNDSNQNILVQPGDTLVLRYKPQEELANFGIATFFTFGIRQLFSGNR